MSQWQNAEVAISDVGRWADDKVSNEWGKLAACRVYHICKSGQDIAIDNPFTAGEATQKPVKHIGRVPGSVQRARTKYDVLQALSYVASQRRNAEERIAWQTQVPNLLDELVAAKRTECKENLLL